jgi:UDP-N-acetylmuramoyl-tripeptide--D-alanyl-D-alanine ligase
MRLSVSEIVTACGGTLLCGDESVVINGASRDNREEQTGKLFIPLKGERFDGHKFIKAAVESGAAAVLSENEEDSSIGVPVIRVDDTRLAMGRLAAYYIKKLGIPTVAITGSVGKTTTKDMVASVLAKHFNVYKTQGNHNNDIGVPLTVFELTEEHTAAVIEMGMNHFEEISYLTKMVHPDVAVITNVGVSHIENLGSREGILKAKCEIFEGLKPNGTAIVNGDNDMLITLKGKRKDVLLFGTSEDFAVYADSIKSYGLDGTDCTIHSRLAGKEMSFDVHISTPGKHMVSNALAATSAGLALGLTAEEIKAGIEDFVPTGMRMDVIRKPNRIIVNDAYNSNPVSAEAGIDVLAETKGKRCAILGDMFELGTFAPSLHYEVGEYAAKADIDEIVCIGELSKNMYEGALSVRQNGVHYYESCEAFFEDMDEIVRDGMVVLVKASRGMRFERITEKLM